MKLKIVCIVLLVALVNLPKLSHGQNVLTQHNDLNRSGWFNQETTLNKSNIKSGSFGKLFSKPVDDQIYAQPLVVNVTFPSGKKNIVIVATVNNSIYAFDADSANVTQP